MQQRLAPGDPGELGVDNLVRPGAQCARRVHPQQEVGVTAPAAFLQAALVDHVGAAPHRLHGSHAGRIAVAAVWRIRLRDRFHPEAAVAVRGQQALLVLDSAPAQQLGSGVVDLPRPFAEAERQLAAQVRQVPAGEEAAEVGSGEGELPAKLAHPNSSGYM